jgi:hypothetical protein
LTFGKIKKSRLFWSYHTTKNLQYEKKIFTKVESALSLCFEDATGHLKDRFTTLCGVITGLLLRKEVALESIGQGYLQDIKSDSRRVHTKRFLENKHVDYRTFYYPFISTILQQLLLNNKLEKQLLLCIDGTALGKNHAALVISFIFDGTSIPFYWITRKGAKGHFSEEQHIELIKDCSNFLIPLLSKDYSVVLLGDGEFDGADLQKLCQDKLGWDYVLRTKCNTVLYENDDIFYPYQLEINNGDYLFIENVAFAKAKKVKSNFVLWHQKELYEHAIPLITTFDEPMIATSLYNKRYSIERLFKGVKSSGFNVDETQLTKPKAIDNLLMTVFLAYILMVNFAKANEESPIKAKVVRIRKEKVLSPIVFALCILQHCIENSINFILSFQISKNYVELNNTS